MSVVSIGRGRLVVQFDVEPDGDGFDVVEHVSKLCVVASCPSRDEAERVRANLVAASSTSPVALKEAADLVAVGKGNRREWSSDELLFAVRDSRLAALEEAAVVLDDMARDWNLTADGHERSGSERPALEARGTARTYARAARKVRALVAA